MQSLTVQPQASEWAAPTEYRLSEIHLRDMPREVFELRSLQSLIIKQYELQHVSHKLFQLTALTYLELGWCKQLQLVPTQVGSYSSLQHLFLRECHALTGLPVQELCQLPNLEYLELDGCVGLSDLPEEVLGLTALTYLGLKSCRVLTELPVHVCKLANLQNLDIRSHVFYKLPPTFGSLTALTSLDLAGCSALAELPESFSNLQGLVDLDVLGCKSLTWHGLPSSCERLIALETLNFEGPAFASLWYRRCDRLKPLEWLKFVLMIVFAILPLLAAVICNAKCCWTVIEKVSSMMWPTGLVPQDLGYRL